MSLRSLFQGRIALGILCAVAALVIFNIFREGPETAVQAAFDEWYQGAVDYLEHSPDLAATPRPIKVRVRVAGPESNEWTVPMQTVQSPDERSRLVRVLQLIHEARAYGNSAYLGDAPESPFMSIAVSEGANSFDANIPLASVEKNIQLQNLIKLLEIFSATPSQPSPANVNPAQL